MAAPHSACYLVIVALLCIAADAARLEPEGVALGGKVKKFHPYTSPEGLFIQVSCAPLRANHSKYQCTLPSSSCGSEHSPLTSDHALQERASKQLPGPGQHFSFGALKPWEDIVAMLQGNRSG
jgi:hypothetical protein